MKKYLKQMIPAIILAFTTGFMLFVYEPLILYSSNTSDFWFDIYTIFYNNIIIFLFYFFSIILIYSILFILGQLILKEKCNIYYLSLLIGFIAFFVTYIQGNYLSGSLPVLDGSIIIWNNYKSQMLISVVLLLAVTIIITILTIKLKYKKVIKYLTYVTIAVLGMLLISLIPTVLSKDCLIRKEFPATATTKNINEYSTNKNFIIFLLDAVDSFRTSKIINENPEYQNIFEDFTYYPDTVSGYVFTRDSIPLILSGHWSENKMVFSKFYNEAMDNSKLIDMLNDQKYTINIYDNEISYNTEKASNIKNLTFDNSVDLIKFAKQEIKYDLFKYLPFYLKRFSKIETMDFIGTRQMSVNNQFKWDNTIFYNDYLNETVKTSSKNEFKFIHIEGAHTPFDCDKDLQPLDNNGTYEQKVEACLKIINTYISYLKENNVYDNSVIIIMADHGYEYETEHTLFRQNPIFYVKGLNEKHEFRTSSEKVSFDNLMDIYSNLLEGKDTSILFDNIDTSKPRRILLHETFNYDHLTEYMQQGMARNYKTTIPTGNTFYLGN